MSEYSDGEELFCCVDCGQRCEDAERRDDGSCPNCGGDLS